MNIKVLLNYVKRCEGLGVQPTVDGLRKYYKELRLEEYNAMI